MWLKHPILSIQDMEVLKYTKHRNWSTCVIDMTYESSDGAEGLVRGLERICDAAEEASKTHEIIVLSDRGVSKTRIPVSSLLCLGTQLNIEE